MRKLFPMGILCGLLAGCAGGDNLSPSSSSGPSVAPVVWKRVSFPNLLEADVQAGGKAFSAHCQRWKASSQFLHEEKRFGTFEDWKGVCARFPANSALWPSFFKDNFNMYALERDKDTALLTGYYAPSLRGRLKPHKDYPYPVYARPVESSLPERRDIEQRPPAFLKPIAWVNDGVDLFFLQIQGSGQLHLENGQVMRLAYDGQNGHPYVPIGRVLVQRGLMEKQKVSMQSIRQWLHEHPQEAKALMWENPSYVFFKLEPMMASEGPKGAAGIPLTAQGSIAIDKKAYPFGVPVWIETTLPSLQGRESPFAGLFVTQDTGGAIKGVLRADLFWGAGKRAEELAGLMKQGGKMFVLLPKTVNVENGEAGRD